MASLGRFLHPEIVQQEFPNAVVPRGITRDLAALAMARVKGAQVITGQRFDILRTVAEGHRVALELDWSGTLQVQYGSLSPGTVMRAHVAAFYDLRDGRIVALRSYDCYEPWAP